ncbi:MAG: hypothetical protein ACJ75H_06785 [Thermoanaerobaculia bacterium]
MRQRADDRLDWIEVVRPHLGAELVSAPGLETARTLTRQLPGDAVAALEARLAPGVDVLDLSLRITRPRQAREVAERLPAGPLRAFLLDWAEAGDASPVSSVWLELDADRMAGGGPPEPVICAGLRGRTEPGWITDHLLPSLRGSALSPRQKEIVEACRAAIPDPARLLYAFSLLPRGAGEVRLEILGLDAPGIAGYLSRVAPEALGAIEEILPLFAGVERLHLSLDIGERISSRMGIEGSFRRLPKDEVGWRRLFDRLVERGLCAPEKRDAALAWPGHDSFRTAPERWPAGADRAGLLCVRSLSHVKVVAGPGRMPEAKVYLLITPFRKEASRSASPGES